MKIRRLVALASLALAPALGAQAAERAVFLVRLGNDTLAVENASRIGRRLEGRLLLRVPLLRIGQEVTLTDSSTVERVVTLMGDPARGADTPRRAELTFLGLCGALS